MNDQSSSYFVVKAIENPTQEEITYMTVIAKKMNIETARCKFIGFDDVNGLHHTGAFDYADCDVSHERIFHNDKLVDIDYSKPIRAVLSINIWPYKSTPESLQDLKKLQLAMHRSVWE